MSANNQTVKIQIKSCMEEKTHEAPFVQMNKLSMRKTPQFTFNMIQLKMRR